MDAMAGSLPIGLKSSGRMQSNCLLGDESRGSAFQLPLNTKPQEPMLSAIPLPLAEVPRSGLEASETYALRDTGMGFLAGAA